MDDLTCILLHEPDPALELIPPSATQKAPSSISVQRAAGVGEERAPALGFICHIYMYVPHARDSMYTALRPRTLDPRRDAIPFNDPRIFHKRRVSSEVI